MIRSRKRAAVAAPSGEEVWSRIVALTEHLHLAAGDALPPVRELAERLKVKPSVVRDALMRNESCGGHFREEHQTSDGEAKRDDANYAFVAAWEYQGEGKEPALHKEPLRYEEVHMTTRVYQ